MLMMRPNGCLGMLNVGSASAFSLGLLKLCSTLVLGLLFELGRSADFALEIVCGYYSSSGLELAILRYSTHQVVCTSASR